MAASSVFVERRYVLLKIQGAKDYAFLLETKVSFFDGYVASGCVDIYAS